MTTLTLRRMTQGTRSIIGCIMGAPPSRMTHLQQRVPLPTFPFGKMTWASHPPPPPRFDARDYIKRYEAASATWHASLASGLRTAYGRASDRKRSTAPRSSQATGPIRIRLAMRACHHWYKLEHAQWGSVTPLASRGVLLARLHHVYDASVAWGTLVPPPAVAPDWDTNDRVEWDAWASDAIPAIHRFMILSGVAHVQGTFCTHPMGNETRLPCGPSLGGALRPGGTNTIIDGLLLYDDTSTHERWNCSDADLW